MNVSSALLEAKEKLKRFSSASLDAELILGSILHLSREKLMLASARELTAAEKDELVRSVALREEGYPIAYLLGHKEFWSLDLKVVPGVFIPRPETELLVEEVLAVLPKNQVKRVLDLGAGSGAIALAIASERLHWEIVALDFSKKALDCAHANAALHEITNVSFILSDWFHNAKNLGFFDAIISNPPYIAAHEMNGLKDDVLFEPQEALFSKDDGLYDLSLLIDKARSFLKKDGFLCLEHGANQGKSVRNLLEQNGYQSIYTRSDLASLDRMTCGVY